MKAFTTSSCGNQTWVDYTEESSIKLRLLKQAVSNNCNYMLKQPVTITVKQESIKVQLHKAEPNVMGYSRIQPVRTCTFISSTTKSLMTI